MLDAKTRQALAEKLQGHIKKASSNVSTKVEAERGDYKIVLTADKITQLYKGQTVGTIRVAELDEDTIGYINSNPDESARTMLDGFRENFDIDEFEKTAAHSTQNEDTYQKVTQKQLDDQKITLHPRTDEHYKNITQKQIPEHGQRPGTYEYTTEAQLREERETFYGASRTSGDWKQEDRNVVTEGQFDEGVNTYSDIGETNRGEIGANYDGGLDKQWKQIGEKQLMELLKSHEWTEPLTITEGKDQLSKQDGELARLTAEVANNIVKESLNTLGKTVLAAGITPKELAGIVQRLISHESKYSVLANVIANYKPSDVAAINRKVAKAQVFGKTANTGADWSPYLAADVLIRQLSKLAYAPQYIVDGLVALSEQDLEGKISEACEHCLNAKEEDKKANSSVDIFRKVIAEPVKPTKDVTVGDDSDGMYAYKGLISEVSASTSDRKKFADAAATLAKAKVAETTGKELELIPQSIDVNEDDGHFEVILIDAKKNEETLKVRAEKRRTMVKEAQMGGAGGMPPAAGPEMGNPAAPPGGGDMGMPPPGEALSQAPPAETPDVEETTGEPQPPGSVCPVCGSNDVDVDNGEFRCNNCGGEGNISVRMEVSKWPETIQETEEQGDEGFGLGAEEESSAAASEEGLGGEGGPMGGEGEGATLPNVPVGASVKVRDILKKTAQSNLNPYLASVVRITPVVLEKIKAENIKIGSVCPNCGGHNTDLLKSEFRKGQDGICWDCLQEYNMQVRSAKNQKHRVYAQYVWKPNKIAESECDGCNRLKAAFIQSLENYGINWNKFANTRTVKEQGDIILKMAKAGALDLSDGLKATLPLEKVAASPRWKGYDKLDKFPSSSCLERISRRFGENATSMSGPCQGKPLAECVCGQLEQLKIYSDGLAAKVASTYMSNDPMIHSPVKTCIAMFVKDDYNFDDACTICEGLRAAHASIEDLVIEAIAQIGPSPRLKMPKPMAPKPMAPKPMDMSTPTAKPMGMPGGNAAPVGPKPMPAPTKPMGMDGGSPMSPKPMDLENDIPDPMDEPVSEDPMIESDPTGGASPIEDATSIGDDLSGGEEFSDDFGTDDIDLGFGGAGEGDMGMGETVTLEIPAEAVDAIQTLFDALQGQIGAVDTTGDLDMGEVGDIGEPDLGLENGGDEIPGIEETEDSGIPGLMEDQGEEIPGVEDDSVEHEESETPAEEIEEHLPGGEESGDTESETEADEGSDKPDFLKGDDDTDDDGDDDGPDGGGGKPVIKKHTEDKGCAAPMCQKSESEEGQEKVASLDRFLSGMKTGTMKRTQDALDSLFDGIIRQAELGKEAKEADDVKKVEYKENKEGDKVKVKPAQDAEGIGKIQDKGKIGHEEKFDAKKPDVPREKQLLGDEGKDMGVSESEDLPTVPHGGSLMDGEEHYKPEQGNVLDGNQGGKKASSKSNVKIAAASCKCGNPVCKCKCKEGGECTCKPNKEAKKQKGVTYEGKHYDTNPWAVCHTTVDKKEDPDKYERCVQDVKEKSADMPKKEKDMAQAESNKNVKTAKVWTIAEGHKHYSALSKKAASGQTTVKLQDGITYSLMRDQNQNFILIAQNSDEIIKESQTVTVNRVKSLEDDPDINQSSGPGKGKVKGNQTHSLAVDEKKPSEGMSEPSIPEAPDGGQLKREHTYDNKLDMPEIPAGGGMNSEYDKNEKNTPEKQDQMLGKNNETYATDDSEAIKLASRLAKANLITLDEIPDKVAMFRRFTPEQMKDYEDLLKKASTSKGMQKEASVPDTEVPNMTKSPTESEPTLQEGIQSLFKLEQRNKDYERYSSERGDHRLFH
jgi:hypothetical protein